MKEEKFPHTWKPPHRQGSGSFRTSEGNTAVDAKKTKQNSPQSCLLTSTSQLETLVCSVWKHCHSDGRRLGAKSQASQGDD